MLSGLGLWILEKMSDWSALHRKESEAYTLNQLELLTRKLEAHVKTHDELVLRTAAAERERDLQVSMNRLLADEVVESLRGREEAVGKLDAVHAAVDRARNVLQPLLNDCCNAVTVLDLRCRRREKSRQCDDAEAAELAAANVRSAVNLFLSALSEVVEGEPPMLGEVVNEE